MSTLTQKDVEHVFEALRKGLVPERGLDAFAVGIEKQLGELHRQLDLAGDGEGTVKFLRGGYGCGKTFMARLAVLDAQAQGFATSFVVVSDNDLKFHRFDDVYRKVLTELGTASCPRGALGDVLDHLRGALEIVKAAGYKGLIVVIDEAETILRMRSDSRHKSLNGIRQIADASGSYPGMLWVFTGTPEFFDTRQGVAGLAPLHDRIRFLKQGRFASLRQAQLELAPFDADRLRSVALLLRELFPTSDRGRLDQKINTAFVERLLAEVTGGLQGNVGVGPRQFLREFVHQLDLVA